MDIRLPEAALDAAKGRARSTSPLFIIYNGINNVRDINRSRSKLCTSPIHLLSDRIYKRKRHNLILRKLGG